MTILRNMLAVILGLVIGGSVNMAIVNFGPEFIPPPAGVDVTDMESIRESIHLFQVKHFITPFFAHALGTLAGAFVAFMVAASRQRVFSFVIGGVFFAGGIAASVMIPAPYWFITFDLLFAYFPMAWVGIYFGLKYQNRDANNS